MIFLSFMRRIFVAISVLLLLTFIPSTDADSSDYVRISDVLPTTSYEGVGITNFGSDDVDLSEYTIEDGEGKISFNESLILQHHTTLFILKSEPDAMLADVNYLIYGTNGVECTSFALNDSGDDIRLCHDGVIIDAFLYGNVENKLENGWNGENFQNIGKGKLAHRSSITDTDSSDDWVLTIPGKRNFSQPDTFDAIVSPFTFPESKGVPVMNELCKAKESIILSAYMINHSSVISVLIDALERDVSVRILVEGSPVGGINDSEITALCTLSEKGAEVKALKSSDGYKRFDYNHSKYAVIDGRTTIITSENWMMSSFESNRGWGVVIRSEDCANFFTEVFDCDFINECDTVIFSDLYDVISKKYDAYSPLEYDIQEYECEVIPVLSPDYSWDAMRSFITGAEERIFSEQLEVSTTWTEGTDNPLIWMSESEADSRLIVNTTYSEIPDVSNLNIVSRTNDDIFIHNKGVIVDNKTWVGSVNWVDTSFNNNREVAVIIDSKEISDYFAEYFIEDWGSEDTEPISIDVVIDDNITSGRPFLLDATGTFAPDDAEYKWNIDGESEKIGKKIILTLPSGNHIIRLTVISGEYVSEKICELSVHDEGFDITDFIPLKYIPIIAICVIILLSYAVVSLRKGSDDHPQLRRRRFR